MSWLLTSNIPLWISRSIFLILITYENSLTNTYIPMSHTPLPVTYIYENRDTHQVKFSTYILILIVTIILVLALASKSTHASGEAIVRLSETICNASQSVLYPNHSYNAPPRLVKNCTDSFIGNEYSEARRPTCERLWGMWSREIMLDWTIYFSKL